MRSKHLNIFARDSRIAGSLTGLGKSRLETLEHLDLSQENIIGNTPLDPRACVIHTEWVKTPVHRVQGVNNHTGGGFQTKVISFTTCSSREDYQDFIVSSAYE